MKPHDELAVGDIIDVKQLTLENNIGREHWVPAQIINIGYGSIGVRFINNPTKVQELEIRESGRTWRR